MSAVLRAKVRVSSVTKSMNQDGKVESETVQLNAVYSSDVNSENGKWSKWTPSASFSLTINNPDAMGKLSKGHEFFVDFTPAEKTAETTV